MTSSSLLDIGATAEPLEPLEGATEAVSSAWRSFWLAFCLYLGIALGLSWDRAWHASHAFQSFFSPPHIFIYAMVGLTGLAVLRITLVARLRACFGSGVRVPGAPWEIPGPLALTWAGLAVTGLGGMLDLIWHSEFGLDETFWSFPHGMLGWGLTLTLLGLVSCRLSLGRYRGPAWITLLLFGCLLLPAVAERFTGPLGTNFVPQMLTRIAALRVLAHEASFQHTVRIYLTWNLTRFNPLFVPLAGLAAGAGLALVRGLDRRTWLFLATVLVATLFEADAAHRTALHMGLAQTPAAWMPIPFLPAALVFVAAMKLNLPEALSWSLAGLVCGAVTVLTWGGTPLLILTAALATAAGAIAGRWLARLALRPSRQALIAALAVAVGVPFWLGLLDLWLRTHTA